MESQRLGGLDLLRGVAALCVLAFHLDHFFPGVAGLFDRAYLAVDFFFMLSGFVLTRTYHERFSDGLGTREFMRLRLARLWPTIAVGALIGLASVHGQYGNGDLALFLALNLALLPYLAGGVVFPLNGVIWSIFFELIANAVHAAGLSKLRLAGLSWLALAMAGSMLMAATRLEAFGAGSWDVGSWQGNFVAGLARVMLSYTMGTIIYLTRGSRASSGVPSWAAPVLLVGAIIVGSSFGSTWHFDLVFVVFVCPAVIVTGLAAPALGERAARVAGDLSFPLYAVHVPVLLIVKNAGLPWYVAPPLAILAAVATLGITGGRVPALLRRARQRPAVAVTY